MLGGGPAWGAGVVGRGGQGGLGPVGLCPLGRGRAPEGLAEQSSCLPRLHVPWKEPGLSCCMHAGSSLGSAILTLGDYRQVTLSPHTSVSS